jgi:hypothetical protein
VTVRNESFSLGDGNGFGCASLLIVRFDENGMITRLGVERRMATLALHFVQVFVLRERTEQAFDFGGDDFEAAQVGMRGVLSIED